MISVLHIWAIIPIAQIIDKTDLISGACLGETGTHLHMADMTLLWLCHSLALETWTNCFTSMRPASFAYIFGIKAVLSSSVFLEELLENIGSLNIETYNICTWMLLLLIQ